MNKIKLSKRLLKIANIVSSEVIADVGCDHGKLSYYLLKNNIVKKAYVSDISKPSLNKAEILLSKENLNFSSICCDGLKGFKNTQIDECIIAGMGGDEIINIINNSPIEINSFILSPQHNIISVKKYMLNRGYSIVFDKIIKDGHKFYNIIKCVKGSSVENNSVNMYFGFNYTEEEKVELREYLSSELNKANILYDRVDENKKSELSEYIKLIKDAQKDWKL